MKYYSIQVNEQGERKLNISNRKFMINYVKSSKKKQRKLTNASDVLLYF